MIELSDIEFRWQTGDPPTLSIPRLVIPAGQTVFLQGPSGSGKTTLLNILSGIILPQNGTVRILDQDLTRMGAAGRDQFRAEHLGLIFQVFNLIPYLSLVDNVVLPCQFSKIRRAKALQRSDTLVEAARQLLTALGIEEQQFHKPAVQLSTGQQQRVAVARALIGDPEIIIADEPTSALDGNNAEIFLDLLFRELRSRQASLLFVSHDARLGARFDRRLHLETLQSVVEGAS